MKCTVKEEMHMIEIYSLNDVIERILAKLMGGR